MENKKCYLVFDTERQTLYIKNEGNTYTFEIDNFQKGGGDQNRFQSVLTTVDLFKIIKAIFKEII